MYDGRQASSRAAVRSWHGSQSRSGTVGSRVRQGTERQGRLGLRRGRRQGRQGYGAVGREQSVRSHKEQPAVARLSVGREQSAVARLAPSGRQGTVSGGTRWLREKMLETKLGV